MINNAFAIIKTFATPVEYANVTAAELAAEMETLIDACAELDLIASLENVIATEGSSAASDLAATTLGFEADKENMFIRAWKASLEYARKIWAKIKAFLGLGKNDVEKRAKKRLNTMLESARNNPEKDFEVAPKGAEGEIQKLQSDLGKALSIIDKDVVSAITGDMDKTKSDDIGKKLAKALTAVDAGLGGAIGDFTNDESDAIQIKLKTGKRTAGGKHLPVGTAHLAIREFDQKIKGSEVKAYVNNVQSILDKGDSLAKTASSLQANADKLIADLQKIESPTDSDKMKLNMLTNAGGVVTAFSALVNDSVAVSAAYWLK